MSFIDDYKAGVLAGATDFLLFPRFKDEEHAYVTYKDGELHSSSVDDDVLRKSRVPKKLFGATRTGLMGYQDQKWVTVEGVLVSYLRPHNQWFIAKGMTTGKARTTNKWVVMQLHVLSTRGFLTVLPLCSWATVSGVKADGSAKTQGLPRSTSTVKALYEDRVAVLNQVLEGKVRWYWSVMKFQPGAGKRILPCERVIGLTIASTVYPGGPK